MNKLSKNIYKILSIKIQNKVLFMLLPGYQFESDISYFDIFYNNNYD